MPQHIDCTCAFHMRLCETITPNSFADETTSICLLTISSCFSMHYRVMDHMHSLESVKEA